MHGRIQRFLFFVIVVLSACNNYDLRDKLENPENFKETFTDRLMAFVSSAQTVGNMEALFAKGCSGTGIQRADCYCQEMAKRNGRRMTSNSRFIAWLTETLVPVDNTMLCRILNLTGTGCSPVGSITWYATDFQPIVSGMSNLFNAAPAFNRNITLTETGASISSQTGDVWTGTAQQGTSQPSNCSDWQSNLNTDTGGTGQSSATNFDWTNQTAGLCDEPRRIYCFAVP